MLDLTVSETIKSINAVSKNTVKITISSEYYPDRTLTFRLCQKWTDERWRRLVYYWIVSNGRGELLTEFTSSTNRAKEVGSFANALIKYNRFYKRYNKNKALDERKIKRVLRRIS